MAQNLYVSHHQPWKADSFLIGVGSGDARTSRIVKSNKTKIICMIPKKKMALLQNLSLVAWWTFASIALQ